MAIVIPELNVAPCEECGMSPVNHRLERTSLALDFVFSRLFRPFSFLISWAVPLTDRAMNLGGPLFLNSMAKAGLAMRVNELDPNSSETTLALWREAEQRGIAIYEIRPFGLRRSLFITRHGGRPWVFQGLPRLTHWQRSLMWIDDKAEMKRRFRKAGFPVANGGLCRTWGQAQKLFRSLEAPVIVKPNEGSGGRHTTVHIDTEEKLKAAFENARLVSPFVIVEEELRGPVFRATLVHRKLAGVLRRDPPQVTGDGRLSIRELVERENVNPLRRGPVFADINLDSKISRAELERQQLTPQSVPAKGRVVYFHFKVNWGVGGTSRDATPEVHPDTIQLFEDIGEYLDDDIVGVDFMIEDISRSWRDQERCGVIELNSLPHLGNHHFPFEGPVRNVAGAIWDMIYPASAS